ncbi:MAG: PKD domain-containing protein, partial [Bacteroidota bacterium]
TDGKIQFINRSMDARFYEWDFGNGDFSDEVSPFYEYDFNGNWQVVLTAIHQNGCEDMDTLAVSPEIFFGLHLPNAMSPETGVGDVRLFKPAGIGIRSYTVEIYSPWGQLLWQNSELDGESPKGSWDGSFQGKIVPQGAYVWKAQAEFINGIKQVKTGTVTVLR